MDINDRLLRQAQSLVNAMDKTVDEALPHEIAEIVKFHSKGAAAAGLASGWIPGAGGVAAIAISAGFIWTMYGRIGERIDLPFGKNILKSLATGVATNLAAGVAASFAVSTALSFIPGLGSIGATVIVGATSYALTLASGYIYLKIMTNFYVKGIDLSTINEQELKNEAASAAKGKDVQELLKDAKKEFHNKKKRGEFK